MVCPCSVATVAHIALGTTRTLIHRAADVALKERRPLVVVPRETPLTQIHLRRLLELAEAGAVVLPACRASTRGPGRCRTPWTTWSARCSPPWASSRPSSRRGTGPALSTPGAPAGPAGGGTALPVDREPARISAMFAGIAGRYDLMNRLMTLGLDGGWRRLAALEAHVGDGGRALDACCGTGDLTLALARLWPRASVVGLDFTEAMLDGRAGRPPGCGAPGRARRSGSCAATCSSCRSPTASSRRSPSAGACATCPTWAALSPRWRGSRGPAGAWCVLSRRWRRRGRSVRFHDVWMGEVVPRLGRVVTGEPSAYAYLPASVAAFPRAHELAAVMCRAGLTRVRYRRLGLGAVALHVGEVPAEPAVGRPS